MGALERSRDELEILGHAGARGFAQRPCLVVRGKLPFHFVEMLSQKTCIAVGHYVVA